MFTIVVWCATSSVVRNHDIVGDQWCDLDDATLSTTFFHHGGCKNGGVDCSVPGHVWVGRGSGKSHERTVEKHGAVKIVRDVCPEKKSNGFLKSMRALAKKTKRTQAADVCEVWYGDAGRGDRFNTRVVIGHAFGVASTPRGHSLVVKGSLQHPEDRQRLIDHCVAGVEIGYALCHPPVPEWSGCSIGHRTASCKSECEAFFPKGGVSRHDTASYQTRNGYEMYRGAERVVQHLTNSFLGDAFVYQRHPHCRVEQRDFEQCAKKAAEDRSRVHRWLQDDWVPDWFCHDDLQCYDGRTPASSCWRDGVFSAEEATREPTALYYGYNACLAGCSGYVDLSEGAQKTGSTKTGGPRCRKH